MLSDNLHSLLHTLKPHVEDGIILKPVAVRRICSDLESLVQDALAMEASAIAPLVKSHSDNVVNLVNERARRSLIEHGKKCGAEFIISISDDPDGAA